VKVGQVVRWRNDDPSIPHNATGSGGINTGTLLPGQTSRDFTFSSPGQLNYQCTIHPGQMSGGVVSVTQ